MSCICSTGGPKEQIQVVGTKFAASAGMQKQEIDFTDVQSKIYLIRGHKVMLDFDLADLYQIPTFRLNEQVKRNVRRFPSDFMFSLSDQELRILISQFAISSSRWGGRRRPPLAFTEQGVAMLSSVLKSERAADVNIAIMRAFVRLRQILSSNQDLENKIATLEVKYDGKFKLVFDAIRELMSHHAVPRKRVVGLADEEKQT